MPYLVLGSAQPAAAAALKSHWPSVSLVFITTTAASPKFSTLEQESIEYWTFQMCSPVLNGPGMVLWA